MQQGTAPWPAGKMQAMRTRVAVWKLGEGLARGGGMIDLVGGAAAAGQRRRMSDAAASHGGKGSGEDNAPKGMLAHLSFGIQNALRGLLHERERLAGKQHGAGQGAWNTQHQKPYISWEVLTAKAHDSLRFAQHAKRRGLEGRALDDAFYDAFGFNLGVYILKSVSLAVLCIECTGSLTV
jgi:hypothetical protein